MPATSTPPYAWLDPEAVAAYLGATITDAEAADVEVARQAAADYVERVKRSLVYLDAAPEDIPASVRSGAMLLVSRLLARRSSPAGLATFGEFGAQAVRAHDADIDRMLGLGRYGKPRVR